EHCYFVTQAKVLLAPRGIPLEGRTLYIPLTYASVMSEAESAAIIGHELGHFAAGDTAHGASLSLLQRQVRLRIERIAAPEDGHVGLLGKPGLWAALYFLDRFERAYL
ncbi:M48 family metalloprotease, partial [Morganella morganii]